MCFSGQPKSYFDPKQTPLEGPDREDLHRSTQEEQYNIPKSRCDVMPNGIGDSQSDLKRLTVKRVH